MTQSTNKRQKILDAAIHLFVKQGLHSTSMRAIAEKAGVATGSLYTYFDSKETLVIEAFYSIAEENLVAVTEGYNPLLSVKERFYHLLENTIRFDINNPEKFRFMSMYAFDPIMMKVFQADKNCERSPLAAILSDGKKEHLLKELSIHDFFYHIFGGMSSLLEWRLFNQQDISDTDITNMIDIAWDACVKHPT